MKTLQFVTAMCLLFGVSGCDPVLTCSTPNGWVTIDQTDGYASFVLPDTGASVAVFLEDAACFQNRFNAAVDYAKKAAAAGYQAKVIGMPEFGTFRTEIKCDNAWYVRDADGKMATVQIPTVHVDLYRLARSNPNTMVHVVGQWPERDDSSARKGFWTLADSADCR